MSTKNGQTSTERFSTGPIDLAATPVTNAVGKAQQRVNELQQKQIHEQTMIQLQNENTQVLATVLTQCTNQAMNSFHKLAKEGHHVRLRIRDEITE